METKAKMKLESQESFLKVLAKRTLSPVPCVCICPSPAGNENAQTFTNDGLGKQQNVVWQKGMAGNGMAGNGMPGTHLCPGCEIYITRE